MTPPELQAAFERAAADDPPDTGRPGHTRRARAFLCRLAADTERTRARQLREQTAHLHRSDLGYADGREWVAAQLEALAEALEGAMAPAELALTLTGHRRP